MLNAEVVGGIPLVSVIGTPRTMGEHLGSRLKPRLQVLSQYLTEQLLSHAQVAGRSLSQKTLRDDLRASIEPTSRFEPSLWMEIESMAAAASLPPEDILLVHGYDDLLSRYGCLAPPTRSAYLALDGHQTENGNPWLVMAWHLDPTLQPYVTLLRRIPAHGPASLSITLAGLHPVAGISEADLAAAVNELRVTDGCDGQFTSHLLNAVLSSPTIDDALNRAQYGPRQGGGAIHVQSGRGERFSIEFSGSTGLRLPDPNPEAPRVHTNHPLSNEIGARCAQVGDPSSRRRLERLARQAVACESAGTAEISRWFGFQDGTAQQRMQDSRTMSSPSLMAQVDSTILVICDPASSTIMLRRGGTGANLESIQL